MNRKIVLVFRSFHKQVLISASVSSNLKALYKSVIIIIIIYY